MKGLDQLIVDFCEFTCIPPRGVLMYIDTHVLAPHNWQLRLSEAQCFNAGTAYLQSHKSLDFVYL